MCIKHYKYSKNKGIFASMEVSFQPPIDGCETDEGRHDEGSDMNHLSGNQLLSEADLLINFRNRSKFNVIKQDEVEISSKGKNQESEIRRLR